MHRVVLKCLKQLNVWVLKQLVLITQTKVRLKKAQLVYMLVVQSAEGIKYTLHLMSKILLWSIVSTGSTWIRINMPELRTIMCVMCVTLKFALNWSEVFLIGVPLFVVTWQICHGAGGISSHARPLIQKHFRSRSMACIQLLLHYSWTDLEDSAVCPLPHTSLHKNACSASVAVIVCPPSQGCLWPHWNWPLTGVCRSEKEI